MKQFLITILSLFTVIAQAGSLSFKTDSTNYLIGEQAVFTLRYEGEENVNWHGFNDTLTNELEIIDLGEIDTISKGVYEQKILLTSWDSGYFIVPPIKIGNHQSAPLLLRYNTVAIDPQAEFKPIKNQLDTPFIFGEIKALVFWISIILAVLTGAFLVARHFIIKNRNKEQPAPVIPERPVMEVLWERYNYLADNKIWEKGEEKAFHVELSLILRKFLEYKHNVKALEETTVNINKQLSAIGIERALRDEVSHILNFSDMVKFAKQKGVYTQHENALSILEKILQSHQEEEIE